MNTKRFENKTAIVTGASRGIGQAIALAFAREGAHVVSVDIGDQTETGAKAKALGAKFNAYTEDFGKLTQKGAADLIAKIIADAGRVDILVNNAGIIRRAPIVDHPEADWNALIQINLTAPFFLCQAVAKWWLTGGREASPADARLKIVNIASIAGLTGQVMRTAYAPSKAAVINLTMVLAVELASYNINVNAVSPGYILTDMVKNLVQQGKINEEAVLRRTPLGRMSTQEDVAHAALVLASEEAKNITGVNLPVDAGWTANGWYM